jgi:hypothetical protein
MGRIQVTLIAATAITRDRHAPLSAFMDTARAGPGDDAPLGLVCT